VARPDRAQLEPSVRAGAQEREDARVRLVHPALAVETARVGVVGVDQRARDRPALAIDHAPGHDQRLARLVRRDQRRARLPRRLAEDRAQPPPRLGRAELREGRVGQHARGGRMPGAEGRLEQRERRLDRAFAHPAGGGGVEIGGLVVIRRGVLDHAPARGRARRLHRALRLHRRDRVEEEVPLPVPVAERPGVDEDPVAVHQEELRRCRCAEAAAHGAGGVEEPGMPEPALLPAGLDVVHDPRTEAARVDRQPGHAALELLLRLREPALPVVRLHAGTEVAGPFEDHELSAQVREPVGAAGRVLEREIGRGPADLGDAGGQHEREHRRVHHGFLLPVGTRAAGRALAEVRRLPPLGPAVELRARRNLPWRVS
jgi:hypothetical protein